MFSKETTVGKAGELYLAGDCVKYCQFEVLMVGSPASSNRVFQTALVPIGEEITTWLNEIPVKIKVYGVNEESGPPSCNFSITPSIEGSTEVVDNLNNY